MGTHVLHEQTFDVKRAGRTRAKERVRARRKAGEQVRLADVQLELAREHGFPSWSRLKAHVERAGAEQPFRTDFG
jgi:hypothetical protein